jgi:hypothetical protein
MRVVPQGVLTSEQRAKLEAFARGCALRRGSCRAPVLQERILAYSEEHSGQPQPLIWTAKANDTLEKVKRARCNLNNSPSV